MGEERCSWEAVVSTQMEPAARPSEGECGTYSGSAVQTGSRGTKAGTVRLFLGKLGKLLGLRFSRCSVKMAALHLVLG